MGLLERVTSELAYLRGALRTLNRVKPIKATPNRTMCERMEEVALRHPDRVAQPADVLDRHPPRAVCERHRQRATEWSGRTTCGLNLLYLIPIRGCYHHTEVATVLGEHDRPFETIIRIIS